MNVKNVLLKSVRQIFFTTTAGLKQGDSRRKAWDVRNMLDLGDGERIRSDRDGWSGQERCAFLSVFTLYVYLYLYHFVCLYLDSHTAPDYFLAHSNWWKRDGTRKEQPGFIAATLSSSAMFSVSITYPCKTTRAHKSKVYVHVERTHT